MQSANRESNVTVQNANVQCNGMKCHEICVNVTQT